MSDTNRIHYEAIKLFVGDTVHSAIAKGLNFREGRAGMIAVSEVMMALLRGEVMSVEQMDHRITRIVQRELIGQRVYSVQKEGNA